MLGQGSASGTTCGGRKARKEAGREGGRQGGDREREVIINSFLPAIKCMLKSCELGEVEISVHMSTHMKEERWHYTAT